MKINWGFGPPKDDAERDASAQKSATPKRRSGGQQVSGGKQASEAKRPPRTRKINWGFGPKKGGDEAGTVPPAAEVSEQHTWTAGASMTTRAIVGLLWVALVAGPLALGMQLLFPEPRPVVQQSGHADRLGEAAAVSEFAERAVVAWLETPAQDADSLREYFGDLDQSRPEFPWTTERSSVAEIVKDDSGLWSVVVGVDTAEGRTGAGTATPEQPDAESTQTSEPATQDAPAEDESEGEPAEDAPAEDAPGEDDEAEPVQRITSGRLYFQVPVLYFEGQMVAQALPAPVPAPEGFGQLAAAYDHDLAADHPAVARVTNFLNAMLVTGNQAELEAYSSPGTTFRALNPVPYAAIEVHSIVATGGEEPNETPADGEQVEVQANVTLRGSNEEQLGTQYALVLLARQGRWEVAEIRNSPVLAEPVPVPTPTQTSTPTPTPEPSASGSDSPSGEPTREAGSDPTQSPAEEPEGATTETP